MDGDKTGSPLGTRYVERLLRRTFNLAGPRVTDRVRHDVAPSFEVRPVNPWERDAFHVIPWVIPFATVAAGGAGTFAALQIQAPLDPAQPFDLLLTHIYSGASSFELRSYPIVEPGVALPIAHRDSRWQPSGSWGAGDLTAFDARGITPAAPAGSRIGHWTSTLNGRTWVDVGEIVLRFGTQAHVGLFNLTANQLHEVMARGLLTPTEVSKL